jgi:group I intron endonuclease
MRNVIYKIRNVINNSYYIGSTVDSRKRFWAHRKALRAGSHDCLHLQRAWNKYGEDFFKFEIVEQLESKEGLYPAEQKWLNEHFGADYCYNTAAHADSPMRDASDEMRQRLAEKTKAFSETHGSPRLGHRHTEETKECIRQKKLADPVRYWQGKTRSEETKAKISAAQKGVAKAPRVYTEEGLVRAQANMQRNAREQPPKGFADVKSKFPEAVLAAYNFDNAVYVGALVRITGCVCPAHGVFSQYAAQFRKGRGCPECGNEQRAQAKKKQMLESWKTDDGRSKFMSNRKPRVAPSEPK